MAALAGLAHLRDELDAALRQAVRDLRARGISYAEREGIMKLGSDTRKA